MWSCGMILFECMTSKPLYEPIEMAQTHHSQSVSSTLNLPTTQRKSLLEVAPHSTFLSASGSISSVTFLNNGYCALQHGNLKEYLSTSNLIRHFDSDSFSLVNNLLKINEAQRYDSDKAIKHKWFRREQYFKEYENQIKPLSPIPSSIDDQKLNDFPFYQWDMKSI
eukprot:UN06034